MNCKIGVKNPNVLEFEIASCNHLFKDRNEEFGISYDEASLIRNYINIYEDNEIAPYRHAIEIRNAFPNLLREEDPYWIKEQVNPIRVKKGFEPIN
jgi:hypothetical protein